MKQQIEVKGTARYIGVEKAEEVYGLSRWTFRRWAYSGRLGSCKISKRLLLSVEDIDRLFAEGYRAASREGNQ